ncbi:hypothetical protein [Phenylobacterium immobile]|uniref:hypothetical protein n=1 Tax=Phenylobacterium immobile TaxID=21 RepID=UPI000A4ACB57|nr:hypothetical protein [Phenylobacterium immobile]
MTHRQIAVLLAAAWAIGSPIVQAAAGFGQSQAAFSAAGDETLRAASYAFSIWGFIYAWLAAYAIWQALPAQRDNPRLARLAWPAAAANLGIGAWIWLAAADVRWATVIVIIASASTLAAGLVAARARDAADRRERLLSWQPLALLAGWLTIAAALNILMVMTAEGLLSPSAGRGAGTAGVIAVAGLALAFVDRTRLIAFPLAVAWGLIAVWLAERSDHALAAWTALAAAGLLALVSAWISVTKTQVRRA